MEQEEALGKKGRERKAQVQEKLAQNRERYPYVQKCAKLAESLLVQYLSLIHIWTNAALYQEYSTNPEVYDMVLLSLKKMELSVYEYNNSLFAAPKAHGSLFGYSNEALRRELGLRTNGELYLAYFIIYNIIMEFYTDTISATYAEFVRVEDIVRKVDDTTAGIVDKKNGFVLSEIEENSFRSLALSWDRCV